VHARGDLSVHEKDDRPLPGTEWRLAVDRERAARYGADVRMLGNAVQMVTHGVRVAGYRPDDSDDEVDIRVRYPLTERSLDRLEDLRVPTGEGMLPITNFVTLTPAPKTGTLRRVDGQRTITVQAEVAEGLLVDERVTALRAALEEAPLAGDVTVSFEGEDEDQREAAEFLTRAFATFLRLILTPWLLVLGEWVAERGRHAWRWVGGRLRGWARGEAA
jgi:multidrug efflux pump